MSYKCTPADLENAIIRYINGEGSESVCEGIRGLGANHLVAVLKERGLFRTKAERYQIGGEKCGAKQRAKLGVDDAEIARRYLAGESEKALSDSMGISRSAIRTRLIRVGVTPRNSSESMYLRHSQMTPDERIQLAKAAHDAVRGSHLSEQSVLQRAKTRQQRVTHSSPAEEDLARMLISRGIEVVPQLAIGRYNVDLGAYPVAVEVFGGGWHAYGAHKLIAPERIKFIFDSGWNVIVVSLTTNKDILRGSAADEVVRFIEQSRRDPSFRRQYRVIRGNGKVSTAFRVDLDKVA